MVPELLKEPRWEPVLSRNKVGSPIHNPRPPSRNLASVPGCIACSKSAIVPPEVSMLKLSTIFAWPYAAAVRWPTDCAPSTPTLPGKT